MTDIKRVGVVGAGVVGLACALRLLRDGAAVTLYDPEPPGSLTSFGNAALIMTAQISPLSQPGLWRKAPGMLANPEGPLAVRWRHLPGLAPWFARFLANSTWSQYERIAAALTPLVTRSLDSWRTLAGPQESARLIRQDGLLYVFREPANFAAGVKEAEFRKRFGIASEAIPAEELRQMEPALAPGLAGGLLYPDSAHTTNPAALSAALLDAFRAEGGALKVERVLELRPHGGDGPVSVVSEGGAADFDEVVVCAGVWSAELVRRFGATPLLAAERGYHLMLPQPGVELKRPIGAGDDKFIITPLENGVRLAGTAEFATPDAKPNWRRSDLLLGLAQRLTPALRGDKAERWMGSRPSTPDALPLIGRAPAAPRVICAFGHGHLGLTLAAVTSEIVRDLVRNRAPAAPMAAIRPDRF
ncbi:MAG: FAD-binding oxidoreductase [Hyphomicrobiales bacterium]|nr:FAD-binding oxidoreductase [Hyphomicrobiales bacterium]